MANGILMISTKYKLSPILNDASFRKFYRKKYNNNLSTIIVFCKKDNQIKILTP